KAGIISAASVHKTAAIISAPNNHFAASPHCCVSDSADWRVGGAGACPTVGGRIVRAAGVEILTATVIRVAAPDDHFTAAPYCRVIFSAVGRADDVGGCPSISAGIIFAAGVKSAAAIRSAPHDHFTAAPHCCVAVPRSGRVGGAGSCPTASTGIISPPGVQGAPTVAIVSAPDDHFTTRPYCGVPAAGIGRVGDAGGSPRVVGAATRRTRYCGKMVGPVHLNRLGD